MSKSLNLVVLIGRLGQDAQTRFTASGVAVTNFSLATDRRYKKGEEWVEETEWTNCVLWKSENLSNYLTKGKQVAVQGRLQTRSWEDKEGQKRYTTEVVVSDVQLLGSKSDSAPAYKPTENQTAGSGDTDDVPFMRHEVPVL